MRGRQPYESRLICIPNGSGYISRHWQRSINSALGIGGGRGTVSFRSTTFLTMPVRVYLQFLLPHGRCIALFHGARLNLRSPCCTLQLCENCSDARRTCCLHSASSARSSVEAARQRRSSRSGFLDLAWHSESVHGVIIRRDLCLHSTMAGRKSNVG